MPKRRRIVLAALLGLLLALFAASAAPVRGSSLATAPAGLRLISYYPADGGWTLMWTNWRPERYGGDFARIRSLGANAVRIVVQSSLFGFPQPDPLYLERLRQMIGLASDHGLRVELTLFDWCGYGEIADVAGSEQWARALLEPYAGDRRLAAVELKNEVDPDDPVVLAWARSLIPFARDLLRRQTPVTVSVTGTDPASSLQTLKSALASSQPDFYTLHLFGGGGETAWWALRAARAAVAPQPLWVGETGYPTFPGWSGYPDLPATDSAREAAQAHYLKTLAAAAARNGLPPIGVWALSDFLSGAIPTPDPAQTPAEAEYHYGLYRTDGSAKPAAAAVRRIFGPGPSTDFNGGFEQSVLDASRRPFPAEWSGSGTHALLTLDRHVAHGGHGSALVRALPRRRALGSFSIAPIEASVPEGARVEASVWVRVRSSGALVRLGLDWLGPRALHVKTTAVRLTRHGTGWTRLTIAARRPAVARAVRIQLLVANSGGSVWFDDVRFSVG